LALLLPATAFAEPFIERDRPMFVNNDRFMYRLHLTGYLSHDDGRTWIKGNRISQTGGYSDLAVLPDKRIIVLYENRTDDTLPHGLLLARCTLEWLTSK
jgi:hypothetical protein